MNRLVSISVLGNKFKSKQEFIITPNRPLHMQNRLSLNLGDAILTDLLQLMHGRDSVDIPVMSWVLRD